jgi:hypothetical protein
LRLDTHRGRPSPAAAVGAPTKVAMSTADRQRYALRWAFDITGWLPSTAEWEFALSLLPPADAERCCRFHFEKDRKLAMGSRLLQRKLVHELGGLPWRQVQIGRTREGKPCACHPSCRW